MSDEESPSFYEYIALPDRRPLRFPNGACLALIIWYLDNHGPHIPE